MGWWYAPLNGGGSNFGGAVAAARTLLPIWGRVAVFVVMLTIVIVLLFLLIRLQRRRKPEAERQLLHDLLASDLLSGDGLSEESLSEFAPRVQENCSERVVELFMTFQDECRNFHDGQASFYELAEAVRRDPSGPEAAQMPSCAVKVLDLKKGMEAAAIALTERCRWELRQGRVAQKRPVTKP